VSFAKEQAPSLVLRLEKRVKRNAPTKLAVSVHHRHPDAIRLCRLDIGREKPASDLFG
jgi:hypothetical protein